MAASNKIAILGSGVLARRLFLKLFEEGIDIVLLAETPDNFNTVDDFGNQLVMNLTLDTIYGRSSHDITYNSVGSSITIDGRNISLALDDVVNLPLGYHAVDVLVDCSCVVDDGSIADAVYNAGGKTIITTTYPQSDTVLYNYYNGKYIVTPLNDTQHGINCCMAEAYAIATALVCKAFNDDYGITLGVMEEFISNTNYGYVQDYPDGSATSKARSCDNVIFGYQDGDRRTPRVLPELNGKIFKKQFRINTKNVNTLSFILKLNSSFTDPDLIASYKSACNDFLKTDGILDTVSLDYNTLDYVGTSDNKIGTFSSLENTMGIVVFYDAIMLQVHNIVEYIKNHAGDWSR